MVVCIGTFRYNAVVLRGRDTFTNEISGSSGRRGWKRSVNLFAGFFKVALVSNKPHILSVGTIRARN